MKSIQKVLVTKTKSLKGINNFFLIIGVIIIFIAPLVHIEFDKKNKLVEEYKLELNNDIIVPLQASLKKLENNYRNKKVSAENYINKRNGLELQLLKSQKQYTKLVRIKEDENRIFGWLTIRKFLNGFGIRVPYLLFSLIISFLISIINTKDQSLKRTFLFLQLSCYTISAYVIVWCFWYSQDYPLSSYRLVAILICAFISICLYYFTKYTRYSLYEKLERLKDTIRTLFNFILVDSKKEDFIRTDKKDYYQKRSKELVEYALINENETNLEQSELFFKESKKEASKLISDLNTIYDNMDQKELLVKKEKIENDIKKLEKND